MDVDVDVDVEIGITSWGCGSELDEMMPDLRLEAAATRPVLAL